MDDADTIRRIDELVAEEHRLRSHASQGHPFTSEDQSRLRDLEERLDQCWDLLRRRRAQRDYGHDPDYVTERTTDVVEHYDQ